MLFDDSHFALTPALSAGRCEQGIVYFSRFTLSLRDGEDLLAERGVAVSYETVRRWVNYFGPREPCALIDINAPASGDHL